MKPINSSSNLHQGDYRSHLHKSVSRNVVEQPQGTEEWCELKSISEGTVGYYRESSNMFKPAYFRD